MKPLIYSLCILCLIYSCKSDKREPINEQTKSETNSVKQIQVTLNPNISTTHIIELFIWPGEYPTRPIIVAAQKHFEPYKNHRAVILTDSLVMNEVFFLDELIEILLYLEDLPSTNFKYPLEASPYSDRIDIIKPWIEAMAAFYVDADVAAFQKENKAFYEGARQEVIKNLPPKGFVGLIESYYRTSKIKYTIIPEPGLPTGGDYGYRGIGPYVYTDEGMLVYQVISASLPVTKDSITNTYTYFGFDNKEYILRNSYHEFGHSFVNTVLSKKANEVILDQYKNLFMPELKAVMATQGYGAWFDCVAEHLVRLGEIRLAERSGNAKWAEELRYYHIKERNFIFLPELEAKIMEYEQDKRYTSFEQFLPELLKVLDQFDEEKIRRRINKLNS